MERSLLHVGCGSDRLPEWLVGFKETRLDINEAVNPDIVASMLALGDIGEYDAVFCQHALEHVHQYEVEIALSEFRRVLKPGGVVIVFVPDLEGVKPTHEVLLQSPAGPITGHDLFYGYGKALSDNPHMAHKTGFVSETLHKSLTDSGFVNVKVNRLSDHNMMGAGNK